MVHYQGTTFHPRLGTDHQLLTPVEFLAHLVHHVLLRFEVSSRSYGAISTTFRRKLGWIENPPVHNPPPEPLSAESLAPQIPPSPQGPSLLETLAPTLPTQPPGHPPQPTSTSSPTAHPAEAEDSEFIKNRRRRWAKLIAQVWHVDPSLCASCRHPMKITAAIGPDQPDVIERILRHLHLWDPPWLRPRNARGPPPGAGRGAQSRAHRTTPGPTETIDFVISDELYSVDPIPPDDT